MSDQQAAKHEGVEAAVTRIEARLAESNGETDTQRDWLAHNFRRQAHDLVDKAHGNSRAYVVVNLVVIGGGFATSGIALAARGTSFNTSWIVFGVGLLVALAGGLSQQFRFGFRSSERRTLVLAFLHEGWHFAMATGAYAGQHEKAWHLFVERIDALNNRAAAVASIESELPKQPRSGRR